MEQYIIDILNEFRQERKERIKRYRQQPWVKDYYRNYQKKYQKTEKAKNYIKEYYTRPEVKARPKKYNKEKRRKNSLRYYRTHPIVKLRQKEYAKKNPQYSRRKAKHHRQKGFILISNNPFPPEIQFEYHHIRSNLPFVIPLPKITHRYELGGKHSSHNDRWIKQIYGFDVTLFIGDFQRKL